MSRPPLKIWLLETRPQFLLLSVVLSFLGTSIAAFYGFFELDYALLAFIGLLLSHVAVNVLNDYDDYKSGVDLKVQRTPFSGGSGLLPARMMSPKQALWLGIGAFLAALAIGIYFMVVQSWLLLPIVVVAALCILLYTPVILKTRWPEWTAGLGLGFLPILGTFFVQSTVYTGAAMIASIPSFFMVHNLLLLNEFPDVEADKTGNRRTLPITMGKDGASKVYSALTIAVYVWIIGAVAFRQMPVWTLLALLSLPFAIKAIKGSRQYNDMNQIVPAMGNNVLFILLTHVLMGVGYILGRVVPV